jgi:hypothetical protein
MYNEAQSAFHAHNRRTNGAREVRHVQTVTRPTFWQRVVAWLNVEVF